MRAVFGLVSLLVVVALMVFIFKTIEVPKLEEGKKAQDQARQISGRGEDGQAAISSFKTQPESRGSRLQDLLVTQVTPGGAMDQFYGLKKGDRIVQIETQAGMSTVSDASNDDAATAKALVHDAFQASRPIVVMRDGQQITLPMARGTITNAPHRNTVHDQVDNTLKTLQGTIR